MLVIDANVLVKMFVYEPGSESASSLLSTGESLVAPAHVFAEFGEVISRKMVAGFVDREQCDAIIGRIATTVATFDTLPLLPAAVDLSLETGASVYDCLYIALAQRERCRLVTADQRLVAKMSQSRHAPLLLALDSFRASP